MNADPSRFKESTVRLVTYAVISLIVGYVAYYGWRDHLQTEHDKRKVAIFARFPELVDRWLVYSETNQQWREGKCLKCHSDNKSQIGVEVSHAWETDRYYWFVKHLLDTTRLNDVFTVEELMVTPDWMKAAQFME